MKLIFYFIKGIGRIPKRINTGYIKWVYGIKSSNVVLGNFITFPNIQHKKTFNLGEGVTIMDHVILKGPNIELGNRSVIHEFCLVNTRGGSLKVGEDSSINSFSKLSCKGGVTIGSGVRIGSHFSLVASTHVFEDKDVPIYKQGTSYKGIHINDNVWIGTNVVVLDGVTVGKNSIIAAGAVVNKDVPDNVIVAGVPAKIIRER